MKKGLILLFLLLVPVVYSADINDFNDYASLKIGIDVNNSFTVQGSKPRIDFISANLSFYPRTEGVQKVDLISFNSEPFTQVNSYDNSVVPFVWNSPGASNYFLDMNSVVSVENAIQAIDSKIKFPLEHIDTQYTQPGEYIDIDNSIRSTAQKLAVGEDDLFGVSFKIADWVERNVKYDLSTLTANAVQKSSWVMENKEGVCDELTNLFISMMRSLGVPARFVSGVAYTNVNHAWGPHAWAEVYFPEKGWVPFDITYRQFGWIDPSHVKLKTSVDSGESSIKYMWKGSNIDVKVGAINVAANLVETGPKIKRGPVALRVRPLASNVGPGSYVPLEITLENLQPFYVPETISVTKSQELTGDNVRNVLLKPAERKTIYWVMKVPLELDPAYVYTTLVEIEDGFHTRAKTNVSYMYNGDVYTKEAASEITTPVSEDKSYSSSLSLICKHESYAYTYEKFYIGCTLRNKGNKPVNGIRICLMNECRISNLGISEESYPNFTLSGLKTGRQSIDITADSNDARAVYRTSFNVLENPDLIIQEFNYNPNMDYNFDSVIEALLFVKAPVHDVTLYLDSKAIAKVDTMENSKKVLIKVSGSQFNKNKFTVKIAFKDRNEKQYSIEKSYDVNVSNVPWFVRLIRWISGQ